MVESIVSKDETPTGNLRYRVTKSPPAIDKKTGNIQLQFNDEVPKNKAKTSPKNSSFKQNLQLALRITFGVMIGGMIQTRNEDDQYALFPSSYFLGGLTYASSMVIFSAGRNFGETLKLVWQEFAGVATALVYNILLFAIITPTRESQKKMTLTFEPDPYFVSLKDVYTFVPFIILFTCLMFLAPIETNTKKFAVGMNLYFTLTVINPNEVNGRVPITDQILENFAIYALVGVVGSFIAIVVMLVPYPLFAIKQLRDETQVAHLDMLDTLNVIVDAYCFKNKSPEESEFIRTRLRKLLSRSSDRYSRMLSLLDSAWWEQSIGIHWVLGFHKVVTKQYILLYGELIDDLRALKHTIRLEKYDSLHLKFMRQLQRRVYEVQITSGQLLKEISDAIHDGTTNLQLNSTKKLKHKLEVTLKAYQATQRALLKGADLESVENNMTLNLFLFGLTSYCETLLEFENRFNLRDFNTFSRFKDFIFRSMTALCNKDSYSRISLVASFKVTIAIIIAIFPAIFVFEFNSTIPSSIAVVMGSHLGGSFSVTKNRVAGVVAGSVLPSIFKFFICQGCKIDTIFVNAIGNLVLFVWTSISMYAYFSGGPDAYAGIVSAFIAASILLEQCECKSPLPGTFSYASLAYTSMGMLIFILVEISILPQSALRLLKENIIKTLNKQERVFSLLFLNITDRESEISDDTREEINNILYVELPDLLSKQKDLVKEASLEPVLWRPSFSKDKYSNTLHECYQIKKDITLLYNLEKWYHRRIKEKEKKGIMSPSKEQDSIKWDFASQELHARIVETFETVEILYEKSMSSKDSQDTATYLQLTEAFRAADTDGSGEISADEVRNMLHSTIGSSVLADQSTLNRQVQEFMNAVDKDRSGQVSFEEFLDALNKGLSIKVEYSRKSSIDFSQSEQESDMEHATFTKTHDIIAVDTYTLDDVSKSMLKEYVSWLLSGNRFEHVSIEELLLLNCFISVSLGISKNLTDLERIIASN